MHIVVCCATRRGYHFVEKLAALKPDADLTVFSFPEDPWEPPFLDDICALTQRHGGTFYEARQVGADRWRDFWRTTDIDLLFAVSWRYMIPPSVYQRARSGGYVFHDSLLPAYRGFAPTVWALINGEAETGATLCEMVDEYDAGRIIAQARVPIGADDTIADLLDRVTAVYLRLLEDHLDGLLQGPVALTPQDERQASYGCKLLPEDFRIDWSWPTARIYNLIRATTRPYAGAYTTLEGQCLRIWMARPLAPEAQRHFLGRVPGRVVTLGRDGSVVVLTGDGELRLEQVQLADGPVLPAADVINRYAFTLGR